MNTVVAIVNWNSGRLLRACVESLIAAATSAEILIVDNASEDDSMAAMAAFRNRVHIIRNSGNRGFAAAVNQCFHATSSSYVLVLNPDIRVGSGAVRLLEEFMAAHPRAGAAGGYVNEKYLPRNLPTTRSLMLENLGIPVKSRIHTNGSVVAVEQPAAAALMIRRDAYETVGGFDEQFYPAWYEDVDFCNRLVRAGWEIYFVPKAEFIHEGGYSAAAMGKDVFLRAYYRNQLRYAQKHLGSAATVALRVSIAAGMLGRILAEPKQARAYGRTLLGVLGGW
jgi:N-acetylglucosaminyl-diphospho-decaprenol L-rhamnosyltransferase